MTGSQDKPTRYIFLDVETTGLDPRMNDVIEIGAICFEDDNSDNVYPVEIARYSGKMSSDKYQLIDPEALQVNGRMLYGDVASVDDSLSKDVWMGFTEWLIRYNTPGTILLGHNLQFDLDFIKEATRRHDIDVTRLFNRTKIDTKQVAAFLKDAGVINPDNLRLITLWNYMFLDHPGLGASENAHNAILDCTMCYQIYFEMREAL